MATDRPKRRPKARLEADDTALLAPLDSIVPGTNARTSWDVVDDRLVQLAESIQEQGILEPILVRELHTGGLSRGGAAADGRRFELIAGFRRYAAAKHLGLDRVPVRLLRASDEDALALNLAENLARTDLSDTDALASVAQLQDTYGWGVRKIARITGRSPSWISELLAVARSRPEREAVQAGRLAVGGAARLARLKGEFSGVRDALLERLARGEDVMIEEVPRLSDLRRPLESMEADDARSRSGGHGGGGAEAAGTLGGGAAAEGGEGRAAHDQPAQPARSPQQLAPRQELALSRQDQSLVRNAGALVHQALTSLYGTWSEQGLDCTLPPDVRDSLQRAADEIQTFLAREAHA